MTEYKRHIEAYSDHSHQNFTQLLPKSEWGNKEVAENYLKKFWLPASEYEAKWKQIQDQIFITSKYLPELIFSAGYEMLAFRGGCLFLKEDFEMLQKCFIETGDKHFFVIENTFGGDVEEKELSFRMKYPTNISWEELISGDFISAIIVEFFNKEFFVFGETVAWGKYSASSYDLPLDIVGFLPKYAPLFRKKLKVPEEEWREIATWLPKKYYEAIKM